MQPTMEEWKALYNAAITFRDTAPWRWMWDDATIGVQDPESGEIAYCIVMGRLGEHFALGAYRGSKGLDGLWRLRLARPEEREDPGEILSWQDCLSASFEDRSLLDKDDLAIIKALGLKFRGRNAWPRFRNYLPGYMPWFVTAPEARFLTVCLQQALDVAERFREDEDLLPEPTPQGVYLVRVPERQNGQWVWKDTLQRPAPAPPAEAPSPPPLDEARLRHLRETLPASQGVLEMEYFYTPATIKGEEDERPWYPELILAADAASGLILATELARPGQTAAKLVEQLLTIVEQIGARPVRVNVQREETRQILKPVGDRLGIRVVRARRLPAVAAAHRELETVFMR